ncbi:FtsW/RodA/SpoVE family cell cycle protein [Haliangium ochraceum]|nr:FtsW/RodA/SpoVE family cell cycle protein [Haliangium ochraceum]
MNSSSTSAATQPPPDRPGSPAGGPLVQRYRRAARTPWGLLLPAVGMGLIGAAGIRFLGEHTLALVQIAYLGLGLLVAALVATGRPRLDAAWPRLGGWLVLGVLVFIPLVGDPHQGARRWIDIGPIHARASLFLVPLVVAAAASYLPRQLWRAAALLAGTAIALQLQPDLVSTFALAAAAVVLLWATPAQGSALLGGALAAAIAVWREPFIPPVPHVEQVLSVLARAQPWLVGLAALLGLWLVLAGLRLARRYPHPVGQRPARSAEFGAEVRCPKKIPAAGGP